MVGPVAEPEVARQEAEETAAERLRGTTMACSGFEQLSPIEMPGLERSEEAAAGGAEVVPLRPAAVAAVAAASDWPVLGPGL